MRLDARWFVVCVVALGCGPAPEPSTSVASKDRIERSEPDAGTEEDATLDLAALLFKAEDLASGFAAGEPSDTAPGMFSKLPKPDAVASVPFTKQGERAGGITAFQYEDAAARDQAFASVAKGMGPSIPGKAVVERTDEIGDQGIIGVFVLAGGLGATDVLFQRCSVVAHIRLSGENTQESALAYGKALDKRISQSACKGRPAGSQRPKTTQPPSPPSAIKCPEAKELLTKLVAEFAEGSEVTVTDIGDLNGDGLNEYAGLFEHQVMTVSWVVSRTKDGCYREVFSQAPGETQKLSTRSMGWVDLSVVALMNRMGGLRLTCEVTMRARFDGSRYVLREVVRAEPSTPNGNITRAECQKQAEGFLAKQGAK